MAPPRVPGLREPITFFMMTGDLVIITESTGEGWGDCSAVGEGGASISTTTSVSTGVSSSSGGSSGGGSGSLVNSSVSVGSMISISTFTSGGSPPILMTLITTATVTMMKTAAIGAPRR